MCWWLSVSSCFPINDVRSPCFVLFACCSILVRCWYRRCWKLNFSSLVSHHFFSVVDFAKVSPCFVVVIISRLSLLVIVFNTLPRSGSGPDIELFVFPILSISGDQIKCTVIVLLSLIKRTIIIFPFFRPFSALGFAAGTFGMDIDVVNFAFSFVLLCQAACHLLTRF